jgi:hypothetical protein
MLKDCFEFKAALRQVENLSNLGAMGKCLMLTLNIAQSDVSIWLRRSSQGFLASDF